MSLRVFTAFLCVALAGCSLGPEYARPDVPVPDAFSEAGEAGAAWPSADWWRVFGSRELEGYIDEARRANADLAGAVARVREADALAKVAGAPLLPAVSAGAGGVRERVLATSGAYTTTRLYNAQISASYEIDFWGKNRAARDAAVAAANATRYDRATVYLTVMTAVATTYFQSIELRDRLAVAKRNLDAAMYILKGLQLQRSVGIATSLDVAQQETTVAALSASIPSLEQQLRQTVHALAILVGRLPESLDAPAGSLSELSGPGVSPGLPSELLARRPDVAEAEANLVAANANIRAARAAFFPSIELTGAAGFASLALAGAIGSQSRVFAAGASLTQPIFQGGALEGRYEFAQARYDELTASYRKAVLSALGNVEDALVAVRQTAEQARRQETAA
ncbi:MAG TPA: efflux transporter outer membrane subunit, partial [Candidatus Bathyarchaeia archaeon]|nr:efflux transporter outer membrane subunit [Candidatus Bathyarchaeia archaeon]